MSERLIVSDLKKTYGDKQVLCGIDFHVEDGEIVALLGANGAGKTTTLECIEGVRNPDSGSVRVEGRFSAQLQSGSLPDYVRGAEILELFSRRPEKPSPQDLVGRLRLDGLLSQQYRQMSVGQKRRLHLALALLPNPDLLLLDEPTAGLDVEGRTDIHREITALRDRGKAVLMATHDLGEVREICDRIIMLRDGTVAFDGTPQQFADNAAVPAVVYIRTSQGSEVLSAENVAAALIEALGRCQQQNLPVLDVRVERGTMEEQFIRLSKGA